MLKSEDHISLCLLPKLNILYIMKVFCTCTRNTPACFLPWCMMRVWLAGGVSPSSSLVPRPHGRSESGLVSTVCTCVTIPRKSGNLCEWSVKSIHSYTPSSLPYHQKAASEKAFLMHVGFFQTCSTVLSWA